MEVPVPIGAPESARRARYAALRTSLAAIVEGEDDVIALLSTFVCELHHAFAYYDWTGFYRQVTPGVLAVGPYQGGHGCLRIPFSRGVCGAAARGPRTILLDDVDTFPDHIACASTTRSELVVPVLDGVGGLKAVFDVDSNTPAAFCESDREGLEALLGWFGPICWPRTVLGVVSDVAEG